MDSTDLQPAHNGAEQLAALHEDPYCPHLPDLAFSRDEIERCLFEIAAHGGNARKAHKVLTALGREVGWTPPSPETLYRWIKGRFRNRYQQIATTGSEPLREVVAREAIDLAIELADAERQAIRQTIAGLADADALQASNILRNLTTAKGINLEQEGKLRGRANHIVEVRGIEEIAEKLVALGVGELVDEDVVDADVVEG